MAVEDSILNMANAALKQNPQIATQLATSLMSNSNSEVLKKLAVNPIFKAAATQLVTTEAFQKFLMQVATSEIGKTIMVNGAKFVVTQQMQNGLGGALSSLIPGLGGGTANANSNANANTGAQVAISLLNQFLTQKK